MSSAASTIHLGLDIHKDSITIAILREHTALALTSAFATPTASNRRLRRAQSIAGLEDSQTAVARLLAWALANSPSRLAIHRATKTPAAIAFCVST